MDQWQRTWQLIRNVHGQRHLPWFIGGDFNEIRDSSKKEGLSARGQFAMDPRIHGAINGKLLILSNAALIEFVLMPNL